MQLIEESNDLKTYFSIIIPMYNREKEIKRAIQSCLTQTFRDFEIIIVDDASSDNSILEVNNFDDPRIKLIRHDVNKGVCPARNTGIEHASADWIIFLDSDDEFLPGALENISTKTKEVSDDIDRIGFMYQWDDGRVSPDPIPNNEIFDYEGYMRWTESIGLSDFNNCIRKKTFTHVKLPEDRSYESIYHLDFAKNYKTLMVPEIVAIEHTDAINRTSNLNKRKLVDKTLLDAPDSAKGIELLLLRHGDALKKVAPVRYKTFCKMRILFYLLAGDRLKGIKFFIKQLTFNPFSLSVWIILISGLISSRLLAWVLVIKRG